MSNEPSSSDTSDDNEVEIDDQDDPIRERVSSLKEQLHRFPASYDTHVELIEALRTLGDLDELRLARENMNAIYPLTPSLWLEWIRDERQISVTDDDKKKVECLFKRALDDYDDISIWSEYCLFAIGNLKPSDAQSIEATEAIFQSALAHQGLNVPDGSCLWDAYRDFLLIVHQYNQASAEPSNKYLIQIEKLYKRQLRVPIMGIRTAMESYKAFRLEFRRELPRTDDGEDFDELPLDCMHAFAQALNQLELLTPFEDKIEEVSDQDQTELLSAWTAYLDWITTYGYETIGKGAKRGKPPPTTKWFLPNHVCCLFERAVTAMCLHPPIWLRFVNYLEDQVPSDRNRALHVLARSVRNCPWSSELWLRYALVSELWALEQLANDATNGLGDQLEREAEHTAFAKVDAVYETALTAGIAQQPELIKLWLAYVDYQLRRLLRVEPKSTEWESILQTLRSTFDRAHSSLHQLFGKHADPDASLGQYHAFIEARHVGDVDKARSVWTHLMKQDGRGSQSRFWLAYLQFERNWGNSKSVDRVSRMALNSISSDPADASFDSILKLVSEAGLDVTHYHDLCTRVRQKRSALSDQTNKKPEEDEPSKQQSKQVRPSSSRKRKASASDSAVESTSKQPKKADSGVTETEKLVESSQPKRHGEFVVHDPSKNDRTVFVSNLDYATTEEELSQTFAQCGSLSSVRLVRDYAGRSKGYAYVEFESSEAVPLALKKDREPVGGDQANDVTGKPARPMFVSVCDPSRSKTTSFHYTAGKQEPEKLFVRNLDKQVTKHALEQLFGQYGNVVAVRLATYRNGAPKGHAYVEFSNADEASRALVATDGLLVGKKNISVAISNPPVRSQPQVNQQAPQEAVKPAANEFKMPTAPTNRPHARTQLSFLPRAISRHGSSAPEASSTEVPQPQATESKSNDDFRSMFLSKS